MPYFSTMMFFVGGVDRPLDANALLSVSNSLLKCRRNGGTCIPRFAYTWDGTLIISENGDMEEGRNPAIYCQFRLTKQDELTGTYYLRQNGGNETKGTITLKRGNPAW